MPIIVKFWSGFEHTMQFSTYHVQVMRMFWVVFLLLEQELLWVCYFEYFVSVYNDYYYLMY